MADAYKAQAIEILLVDDNDDDVCAARRIVKDSRFLNLLHASHDGEEALDYLRREGNIIAPLSRVWCC